MATCVALQADGTLVPTGQTVGECSGYVLLAPAESAWLEVWSEWITPPSDPEVIAQWFEGPFVTIVGFYLVAAITGMVANFFNRRDDE